jgi:hypothetical protein
MERSSILRPDQTWEAYDGLDVEEGTYQQEKEWVDEERVSYAFLLYDELHASDKPYPNMDGIKKQNFCSSSTQVVSADDCFHAS